MIKFFILFMFASNLHPLFAKEIPELKSEAKDKSAEKIFTQAEFDEKLNKKLLEEVAKIKKTGLVELTQALLKREQAIVEQ